MKFHSCLSIKRFEKNSFTTLSPNTLRIRLGVFSLTVLSTINEAPLVGVDVTTFPDTSVPVANVIAPVPSPVGTLYEYVYTVVDDFDILVNAPDFDVVIGDFSKRNIDQFALPTNVFSSLDVGCSLISLTSFGLDQLLSNQPHSDLILQAASSLLYLTGEHHQAPQQLPPYTAQMSGGLAASSAAIAAVRAYRLDKQVRRIDLSIVEALAIHSFTQPLLAE